MAHSVTSISREKTATPRRCAVATFTARFSAHAVLPMPGRPATMMSCPGRRPGTIASMSEKPVGTPSAAVPAFDAASIIRYASSVAGRMWMGR